MASYGGIPKVVRLRLGRHRQVIEIRAGSSPSRRPVRPPCCHRDHVQRTSNPDCVEHKCVASSSGELYAGALPRVSLSSPLRFAERDSRPSPPFGCSPQPRRLDGPPGLNTARDVSFWRTNPPELCAPDRPEPDDPADASRRATSRWTTYGRVSCPSHHVGDVRDDSTALFAHLLAEPPSTPSTPLTPRSETEGIGESPASPAAPLLEPAGHLPSLVPSTHRPALKA